MRLTKFAGTAWIVASLLGSHLLAQNTLITLPDQSVLQVPDYLFHDVSYRENSATRTVIQGWDGDHQASFLLISTTSTKNDTYQPVNDLKDVLDLNDLEISSLGEPERNAGVIIVRIMNPGPYFEHLAAMVPRNAPNRNHTFFIMGPETEFYQAVPAFNALVDHFIPAPATFYQKESITSTMIVTAAGLLLVNIGAIWFGLREIAAMKTAE